jgi:hypothetical protein
MTTSRFEVRENDPTSDGLRSWYINLLTVDEAGMTCRDTILDGLVDEHNAQSLCTALEGASIQIGNLLDKSGSDHRTDDVITLEFRW